MNEITLSGLVGLSESEHAKDADILVLHIKNGDYAPEIIVNPKENFEMKIAYIQQAYNEDLTLKANPSIRIVDFDIS